jgi:hypothetical protein
MMAGTLEKGLHGGDIEVGPWLAWPAETSSEEFFEGKYGWGRARRAVRDFGPARREPNVLLDDYALSGGLCRSVVYTAVRPSTIISTNGTNGTVGT